MNPIARSRSNYSATATTWRNIDHPYRLLVGGVVCLAAAGAELKIPFAHPEGDFWDNVQDYLRTGHVTSTFLPDTYPFIMGHLYLWFGPRGVVNAQVMLYLLLSLCCFLCLRSFLRDERYAAIGTLAVSLNPDLLSSIPKLWDTLPACLGLMGISLLCLHISREARRLPFMLSGLAVIWGVGVSVRPNFALLIVPVVLALWMGRTKSWMIDTIVFGILGCSAYALCNTVSHGVFYLPSNGPYNLFAGANPYAQGALLHGYNGETGIDTALNALGVHFASHREMWLTPVYKREALQFIRVHPIQWVLLMPVKLLNLLRPDLKAHALMSGAGLLKVLTSLWVPIWLLVLVLRRRLLGRSDFILLAVAAMYVLPFLLTNSDPRFRVPLDTLALVHTMTLLFYRRRALVIPLASSAVQAKMA